MRVNNLSKVALDSGAAGIEPAIASRKSNALTTTPPSHTRQRQVSLSVCPLCLSGASILWVDEARCFVEI